MKTIFSLILECGTLYKTDTVCESKKHHKIISDIDIL